MIKRSHLKSQELSRKLIKFRDKSAQESRGGLKARNVYIAGKRTSIRLEEEMWQALADVAERENIAKDDLLNLISEFKQPNSSFTSATRAFLLTYFREAASLAPVLEWVEKGDNEGVCTNG
ncbi:MAG TPA: ribbon-helix-helix domain-containing protein [Kamptonema sp.]|nr:ribbon-helix-helix domain-containing protein [Kamptonema sp.]